VPGEGGYLQAWVEWNGDGDFDDPGEQVATDVQDSDVNDTDPANGVIAFNVDVPETATENPFVRIRWSTAPALPSGGPAPDGESEDYQISTTNRPLSCNMNDLMHGIYNTAAVSANSSELSSHTLIYQASFQNENWQGNVTASSLKTTDDDGNIKSEVWNAADSINRTGRRIFTYVPTDPESLGRRFNWSNLDDKQRLSLRSGDTIRTAKDRVEWVKGSAGSEGANGPMRVRQSILGDIVHSNLNFRSRYTNFGYKQLKKAEGNRYAAYLASKRNTKDTVFVGANDGMLHAFDAENGKELFAYIPNEIIPKLATVSKPKYGCEQADCLPHEYLVDGKSSVADAFINNRWRTVLVGTLGLGGKAIYALDVTKPELFVKRNILWEISDTQAPDSASVFADHMGLSIPEPIVVRMKNGQWAAVVANGYESSSNQAALFIIDIATGQLIKTINTGFGSAEQPNGLSSPTAVDSDGDAIADVIYAGDLQGNLWAFDVSTKNPDKWGSKYGGLNAFIPSTNQTNLKADIRLPEPIFRTCMDSACTQPKAITAKPQVGRNPAGGLMVYFGTGKYIDLGDNFDLEKDGIIDTFYGIHDSNKVIDSSNLVEQKILQETVIKADLKSRVTSKEVVIYPVKQGWYMDLVSPPSLNPKGERVISQALLREGRLIFVTMSPSQTDCDWAGSSWLMELNALDGSRLSVVPIDTNGDKQFTVEDNVDYKGKSTIISGVQQQSLGMVFEPPAIISHNTRIEGKYQSGTGSSALMLRESNSRFTGRMSWKKLR
jgi:type IV pilus assembly protein PilY1